MERRGHRGDGVTKDGLPPRDQHGTGHRMREERGGEQVRDMVAEAETQRWQEI